MPLKGLKGGSGVKPLGYGLGAAEEATDPNFNETVLLLHADGSEGAGNTPNLGDPNYKAFRDNSTSAHAIVVEGDAYGNDFSPYYYADGYWSNSFRGTTADYIILPASKDFDLDTDNFTIEFWAFITNDITSDTTDQMAISASYTTGRYINFRNGSTYGRVQITIGGGDHNINLTSNPKDAWHHFAIVRTNSTTVELFYDGVSMGTATVSGDFDLSNGGANVTHIGAWYNAGLPFHGYLSNFRIIKGTALYTSNFTPSTTPFTDPSVAGEMSVEFDGSNDGLDGIGASDSNLQFGTSDFTVECWVYKEANPSGDAGIIDMRVNSGNGKYVMLGINSGGQLFAYINTAYKITASSSTQLNTNSWHHIAYTRDYSSTTGTLYLDGVSVGTWSDNLDYDESNTELNIGFHNGGGQFFNGFISNVRICKSLVYNSAFTPSTSPFTTTSQSATNCVFLGCRAKSFIDESTNNFPITLADAPRVTEFSPFNDGYWSNDFDGTSDSLTITSTAALQLSGEFTIEFFMKLDTLVVDTQHPSPITFPTNGSYQTQVYVQATDGYVALYYNANIVKSADGSIVANRWYHVAVGRDSSNQIALWLDGVRVATATNAFSVGNSSGTFRVGSYSGTGGDVNGKISNLRIVKGSDVYGYSNTTITVPTSPLTKIGGTSLLTCQSNRFVDNSDSGYSLTVNGNTSIDESIPFELLSRQTKLITCQSNRFKDIVPARRTFTFGGAPKVSTNTPFTQSKTANVGSGFFDGTGDYLTATHATDFDFSGEFTAECWFYLADAVNWGVLFCVDTGDRFQVAVTNSDTIDLRFNGGATGTPFSINKNEWNHVAVTRDSSNVIRQFLNGVLKNTDTNTNSLDNGYMRIGANQSGSNPFNGYVADANIENGNCKYNTSFTPPTSTISADTDTKLLTCQYSGAVRNVGFVDDSKYNHRVTRIGDVHMGTFSPFSLEDGYWSTYHNVGAADSWVRFAGSGATDFNLDDGANWCVEFFLYMEDNSAAYQRVAEHYNNGSYWAIKFNNVNNGKICIGASDTANNGVLESASAIPENQWVHVAFTNDGSTLRIFVDGALSNSASSWTQPWANASGGTPSVQLGNYRSINGYYTRGYISNFRIVKGSSVYTSAFTVPTEPLTAIANTVLLCSQSNRYLDNSTNGYTGTSGVATPPRILPFSPFAPTRSYSKDAVGGSAYFDGTTDGLVLTDATQPIGANNFEVEFWYYPIGTTNNGYVFNTSHNNSSFGPILIYIVSLDVRLYSSSTGSGWNVLNHLNLGTAKANSWNHIYLSRVSNAFFAFVNGVASASNGTGWTTNFTIATAPVHISTYDSSGSGSAYGYIANVQYNIGSGSSTKSVPTAPTTPDSDTYVQLNFDNAGIIDHTMKNNLDTEGNTRISTRVKKFGTGSIYFDGSDELNLNDTSSETFHFGTGLFTVEAFIRVESGSSSSGQWFTNEGHGGWGAGGISIWLQSAIVVWFNDYNASSSFMSYDGDYDDGVMRHFVIVRGTSGACAVFVNGTRVATGTHTGNVGRTGGMGIGNYKGSSRYLTGYIDEMRVTKGVARYDPSQSSVTVPTKAFANR